MREHYVFLTNESEVVRLIRDFVAQVRTDVKDGLNTQSSLGD